jgi:adenylate cyclase
LGVRYVVEGSVRRGGGRVRVTAQLIDATTGGHVWAERYDRKLDDVFAVQDEIAEAVTMAIRPAVGTAEQQRALRRPPSSLTAWEAYQRGMWHLAKGTAAEHVQARASFRRAVELDPGFAAPMAASSMAYTLDILAYGMPVGDAAKLAEAAARAAVAADPNYSESHAALSCACGLTGDWGAQRVHHERALVLNRNSATAHALRGAYLIWRGANFAEAREECLTAVRLDPLGPFAAMNLGNAAAAHYLDRDYSAAVETVQRCLATHPAHAPVRRWLVAGLGQLGRREEAEAALNEFRTLAPGVFDALVANRLPNIPSKYHEHMLDGLRKAGWES